MGNDTDNELGGRWPVVLCAADLVHAPGAAGLDVIDGEWREDLADHPLIRYSREHGHLVITPHIGGVTYESQESAFAREVEKLVDYFGSNPII